MKKLLAALLLFSNLAFAQFDLNDASVDAQKPTQIKSDKEGGLFSFMDFSFKKKQVVEDINKGTTLEQLNKLASDNNLDALLALGYIYLYGDEALKVVPDYNKAFEFYDKAAKLNDPVALNNLANLYFAGIGTTINKPKAAQLFAKASDLGNSDSALNLAFMYLTGNGIEPNPEEAVALFAKASQKDNIIAEYMLGLCYYYGNILPQDYGKAFEFIKKASDANFDEAQVFLAKLYINGLGVPQNYSMAVQLLNKAVIQDNLEAMYSLANILATGDKYPKDLFKAHILYNLAAVRGEAKASERRELVEKQLQIAEILQAQTEANDFVARPTEFTQHLRSTFGKNLEKFINK